MPKEVLDYREPIDYDELVGDMDLSKLHDIFKSIVKKQTDKIDPIRSKFGQIVKEEVDMEKKSGYIGEYIRNHRKLSFRELLEKQHSKAEVIVTFLVILEFIKIGRIQIMQEKTFDDIVITANENVTWDAPVVVTAG